MVPGVREAMGVAKFVGTAVGSAADTLVVAPVVAAADLTKAAAREARELGSAAFDFRRRLRCGRRQQGGPRRWKRPRLLEKRGLRRERA
jgi:hypothetical protein